MTLPTPTGAKSPPKPCRAQGCPNKVRGISYCPEHYHLSSRYRDRQRNNWHTKQGPTDPFYLSKAWRRTTKAYRKAHPLCEECERQGLLTPATCTDHIEPWKEGGAKFDWDNLQALCDSCHAKKTLKENMNP